MKRSGSFACLRNGKEAIDHYTFVSTEKGKEKKSKT